MTQWWNGLSSYQQVLFVIAVATTLIMIVQIIMMFAGMGDDASYDSADGHDGGECSTDHANDSSFGMVFGMRILSVRSILAFFAVGSWIAFTFCPVMHVALATVLGVAVGTGAAFLIAFVMKSVEKLQSSGNIDIKNAIGLTGEVYLTIPALRGGCGKVNVCVQERFTEFEAVTDNNEAIKTGAKIKVSGVLDAGTLVVDKL